MRSASKISHEDKVNLCAELYERGMSTRDIQTNTGIGRSSVSIYLREAGVCIDGAARISKKMKCRPSARKGKTHTAATKALLSQAAAGNKRCLGRITSQASIEKNRASNIKAHPKQTPKLKPEFIGPRKPRSRWVDPLEKVARDHARAASKRMLRRVLTMARVRKILPTEALLGYSKVDLRKHLEGQFTSGMSWLNRDSFHIDHIIPVVSFFRRGIYDPSVINALANLQVLTPHENRRKSDKHLSTHAPERSINRIITITDKGTSIGIVKLT